MEPFIVFGMLDVEPLKVPVKECAKNHSQLQTWKGFRRQTTEIPLRVLCFSVVFTLRKKGFFRGSSVD